MLCPVCTKESKNLRVCPYCFTPYPTVEGASAKRPTSRGMPRATAAGPSDRPVGGTGAFAPVRDAVMRQSLVVRWAGAAILVVALLWALTGRERTFEAGVAYSDIIATPIEREEAVALLRQTRETALVDIQQDEVFVSYPAATFPTREEGQLALVQQFAKSDEIVEGRKRRIFFYNPNGKLFAQSDAARGVVLVR